jgi:hypothetical protein
VGCWVALTQERFRLLYAHLAHLPLPRDFAIVSEHQEVVADVKRVAQACQAASQRAQRSGHDQALASLLAWARGLLGG